MSAFFLAFLCSAMVIAAGRDALFVARLSQAHGRASGLHLSVVLAAAIFAALPTWLAGSLGGLLEGSPGRLFVSLALSVAGAELLFLRPTRTPAEPTQSTIATALVLGVRLISGASGFLLLALAARGTAPAQLTGAGGMVGALAVLLAAAIAGDDWDKVPLDRLRPSLGIGLLAAAAVIGVGAFL